MEEKKQPELKRPPLKPIKLTPPIVSKRRNFWNRLTWWRPLTKKEGGEVALMLLKLSEGILNLQQMQKILTKNNNELMQFCEAIGKQINKQHMAKIAADLAEKKRVAGDSAFQ